MVVSSTLLVRLQNHIDTEKLVDSVRIACHQPGGKNNISPSSRTALIAAGFTFSMNSCSHLREEEEAKTSKRAVLLSIEVDVPF